MVLLWSAGYASLLPAFDTAFIDAICVCVVIVRGGSVWRAGLASHHLLGAKSQGGASPVLLVPDSVRPALHALRQGDPQRSQAGQRARQHHL